MLDSLADEKSLYKSDSGFMHAGITSEFLLMVVFLCCGYCINCS